MRKQQSDLQVVETRVKSYNTEGGQQKKKVNIVLGVRRCGGDRKKKKNMNILGF